MYVIVAEGRWNDCFQQESLTLLIFFFFNLRLLPSFTSKECCAEVMLQSSGLGCWDSSNQVAAYTPKLLPYPNKNVLPLSQLLSCHKHFLCAVTGVLTCSDKTFIKRTIILQDVNVCLLAIEYIICNIVFFFLLYLLLLTSLSHVRQWQFCLVWFAIMILASWCELQQHLSQPRQPLGVNAWQRDF